MKEYTSSTPVFSESIRITDTKDPGHADNVNAAPKQLLQNTLCNRQMIEQMQLSEVDITVSADMWVGTAAPYVASITVQGAAADCTIYVLPHPQITAVQYQALAEASIIGGDQAEETVQLKAYGVKPAMDLPLRFLVSGG